MKQMIHLTHTGNDYVIRNDAELVITCGHATIVKIISGTPGAKQREFHDFCVAHQITDGLIQLRNAFEALDNDENNWQVRMAQFLGNDQYIEFVDEMDYWIQYKGGFWQPLSENDVKAIATTHLLNNGMKTSLLPQLMEQLKIQHHVKYEQLNPSGMLNLLNGILDLTTLILDKHNPAFFFTYQIKINYVSHTPTPTWDQFLAESLDERETLQDWLSGMLHQNRLNEMMLWLYGAYNSGKSVIMDIIKQALGHSMSNVMMNNLGTTFGLEPLAKAMVNIDTDMIDNCFTSATVANFKKLLDMNADVSVNGKNVKEKSIKWKGFLIAASNELPDIPPNTDVKAIMKRCCFIYFPHTFPKNDVFKAKLMSEIDGIFSNLIRRPVKAIVKDMELWTNQNLERFNNYKNKVRMYLKQLYKPVPTNTERVSSVQAQVANFFKEHGVTPPKDLHKLIEQEIEGMGGYKTRITTGYVFVNIGGV